MKKDFIENLQMMLSEYSFTSKNIPEGIKHILQHELWRERDPAPGKLTKKVFKNFKEFCEAGSPFGLNTMFQYVYDLCKRDTEILDLIDRANKNEIGENLGAYRGEKGVYNIHTLRPTGTTAQAGLRTLRKRRPDLHRKVIECEMSVNAAMIEAGFRKKKVQLVLGDIQKIAESLIRHLSRDELDALKGFL